MERPSVGSTDPAAPVRVLVADDRLALRRMVCTVLQSHQFRTIGTAADGVEALELARYLRPEILVLLGLDLPRRDAIEVIRELAATTPQVRTVLCADEASPALEERALLAGASACVMGPRWGLALPGVLAATARGETVSSRETLRQMVRRLQSVPRAGLGIRPIRSPLSDREWQVVDLMSAGWPAADIAVRLQMSPQTVDSHVKNAGRKLGVRGRDATIVAARGLIDEALAS